MLKSKYILAAATALLTMTATTTNLSARENPLLAPSPAPYGAIMFADIQPSDYEPAILEAINVHNGEIEAITSNPEKPTFQNTVAALDRAGQLLQNVELVLGNLEICMGDTALMNVSAKMTPVLVDHYTAISLNEPLWQRIKAVYDDKEAQKNLLPEQQRLLNETYNEFYTSGANLQGADRERYKELSSKLADLTLRYQQNMSNEMASPSRRLWLTADQLSGLPQSIVDAARAEAAETLKAEGKDDDGSYLFTVFFPSYSPFMKYADNRDLRKQMYILYMSRNNGGEYNNVELAKEIANTRLAIANLLGYPTFADYRLQSTMAKNPANVYDLLNKLKDAYSEPMQAELREIEDFARATEGPDFKLEAWDYSYWANKLKNDRYAFNDEDMRPYFEADAVARAAFQLANTLYGYTLKENKQLPVYHPDVKAYEVYNRDGELIGLYYTDLYYRPGKAPGAWETGYREESIGDDGVKAIPFVSIVCNFSKPVGDEPSLLTPYEASTFLHEFGHSLHALSANTTYRGLSGTNVYRDFVETFSQFHENYLKEKQFLDGFARHYKTGESMPVELVDRFIKSGQFGAAYACMRQLGFGFLDMAYYTRTEPFGADDSIEEFEMAACAPLVPFAPVPGCMMSPAFGHIFSGGYAAGYYGYKWSEVLDADAFEAFRENGIYDPATAEKFRLMMEAGGTEDPMTLYVRFRGHEPEVTPLLHRDGIKTDK